MVPVLPMASRRPSPSLRRRSKRVIDVNAKARADYAGGADLYSQQNSIPIAPLEAMSSRGPASRYPQVPAGESKFAVAATEVSTNMCPYRRSSSLAGTAEES
jgi:hypothetical protein